MDGMKSTSVSASDAKTHFSELIERVRQGEIFVVTRHGIPVAKIGPAEARESSPTYGSAKGRFMIAKSFDESLDDMAKYQE
jgi:prevent-host-death family protein